jgi:hypothetical protein
VTAKRRFISIIFTYDRGLARVYRIIVKQRYCHADRYLRTRIIIQYYRRIPTAAMAAHTFAPFRLWLFFFPLSFPPLGILSLVGPFTTNNTRASRRRLRVIIVIVTVIITIPYYTISHNTRIVHAHVHSTAPTVVVVVVSSTTSWSTRLQMEIRARRSVSGYARDYITPL